MAETSFTDNKKGKRTVIAKQQENREKAWRIINHKYPTIDPEKEDKYPFFARMNDNRGRVEVALIEVAQIVVEQAF